MLLKVLSSKNYYTTLDLGSSASTDDIKRSYKNLALQIHPDKNSAPDSEKAFQKLGKAYETLKDPEKRSMYNFQLEYPSTKPGDAYDDDDDEKKSKEMPESTKEKTTHTSETKKSKTKRADDGRNLYMILLGLTILGICYYCYTSTAPPKLNKTDFSLLKSRVYSAKMLTRRSEIVFYVKPNYQPKDRSELDKLWSDVEYAAKKR